MNTKIISNKKALMYLSRHQDDIAVNNIMLIAVSKGQLNRFLLVSLAVFLFITSIGCHSINHSMMQADGKSGDYKHTTVPLVYEKGIDVSHWQGDIDWNKVATSGVKHVFMKMTEGATHKDLKFIANWEKAKIAGLTVGAYHYFRALSSTPVEQAQNIKEALNSIQFNEAKDRLAIDIEIRGNELATPEQMTENLHELLHLIQQNSSCINSPNIHIYTSPSIWDSKIKGLKYDFSIYPLWIAHWTTAPEPRLPKSWSVKGKTWQWWQYSAKGSVDGISENVDLNWVKPQHQ